jgi:hypothetical protein
MLDQHPCARLANNRQAGKSQSAPGRTGCMSLVTASQVSHEDQANMAYAGVGASCDRSTTENGSSDGRSLNLVISNMPDAKETRYLNEARVLGIYPVSAVSHNHIDFGFVANATAIDDLFSLSGHTLEAYERLSAAASEQSAPASPSTGSRRRLPSSIELLQDCRPLRRTLFV